MKYKVTIEAEPANEFQKDLLSGLLLGIEAMLKVWNTKHRMNSLTVDTDITK